MIKLATVLIAAAALFACGDDDADNVVLPPGIDVPDAGEQPPPQSAREWTATIVGDDIYGALTGTSVVRQEAGALEFTASTTIRNDQPGAVRPWHVHFNSCAEGGGIVGLDQAYPRLIVGDDGTAEATVTIPVGLDPNAQYHINVHLSDAQFDVLIACGDLIRSQ